MSNAVIGALRVVLGMDTAQFDKDAGKAKAKANALGSALKNGLAIAAGAASAAASALGIAIQSTIDRADDMSKAASKVGVPIEELSRLKYAADLSGVSFEGLQTSIGKVSRAMNEAKNGSATAISTFQQIGVSATNADGSLRPVTDVLKDVADRFAAMPDGAEKTALAMELMGKSGANMIPLLNGGSEALAALMAEADRFGQVFSKEMGANAEAFNDNISRLQGAAGSLAASLTTALLPALVTISDFAVSLADGFHSLDPAIQTFISTGGALTAVLGAIAIPLGAVVLAIGAIGAPITLAVAGIGLLTAGVVAFWPEIQRLGTSISEFVSGAWAGFVAAWDGVVDKVNAVSSSIKTFSRDIYHVFADLPGQMIEIGGQIIDGLWQGIQAKWESVKTGISDIGNSITSSIKETLGIHSPSRVMHEVGVNIMQGLGDGMVSMKDGVIATATETADGVRTAFDGMEKVGADLGQGMESAFSGIGSSIADAIKGTKSWRDVALDAIGSIAQSLLQNANFGGGIFGGLIKGLFGGLFGFANGGEFQVGGAGGIDSQLVAFRASPNETVSITKPGQTARGGGTYAPVYHIDARGADAGAVARIESALKRVDQSIEKRAVGAVNQQRTRGGVYG